MISAIPRDKNYLRHDIRSWVINYVGSRTFPSGKFLYPQMNKNWRLNKQNKICMSYLRET